MNYTVFSNNQVFNEKGDEIFISALARDIVNLSNTGGEIQIDKILEILDEYELLYMKKDIRQELYKMTDKLIINQRAVDKGDIMPQDRDEMNGKLFDDFIRQELIEEFRRGYNQCLKDEKIHNEFGQKSL